MNTKLLLQLFVRLHDPRVNSHWLLFLPQGDRIGPIEIKLEDPWFCEARTRMNWTSALRRAVNDQIGYSFVDILVPSSIRCELNVISHHMSTRKGERVRVLSILAEMTADQAGAFVCPGHVFWLNHTQVTQDTYLHTDDKQTALLLLKAGPDEDRPLCFANPSRRESERKPLPPPPAEIRLPGEVDASPGTEDGDSDEKRVPVLAEEPDSLVDPAEEALAGVQTLT